MIKYIKLITLLYFASLVSSASAQEDAPTTDPQPAGQKGFQVGLYVGCYLANKYTAALHDGYGLDLDGNKNNFTNSWMNNKINLQYGGKTTGQTDYIAQELNVLPGDWTFDETDMPTFMRYQPAFLIGLQCRYSVDNKNVILLNVDATKITATGGFTIRTRAPSGNNVYNTFNIKGMEQRLLLQAGVQHLFGESEKINFLAEAGLNVTLAKLDKNLIQINNLTIDLTQYYYNGVDPAFSVVKRVGFGFGAFGGIGINMNASEAFIIQLVYNPTYEGINLGPNPKLKLQNAFGIRAYYKL